MMVERFAEGAEDRIVVRVQNASNRCASVEAGHVTRYQTSTANLVTSVSHQFHHSTKGTKQEQWLHDVATFPRAQLCTWRGRAITRAVHELRDRVWRR